MAGRRRTFTRSLPHEKNATVCFMFSRFPPSYAPTYRVSSSIFTADARFVVTGSDDGIVRIWKAKASDKLGIITARERAALEYRDSLKTRWKVDTEVNRVMRYIFWCLTLYPASVLIFAFQNASLAEVSASSIET